jgi:rubrerythrin
VQAQRIYEALAERFADQPRAKEFFQTLAEEEGEHFQLLELCRQAASREGWQEVHFTPWRTAVPRLEQQMDDARERLSDIERLADALRLVIRIETSEINHLFGAVVAATDSGFVRTLKPFQAAASEHISQITGQIAVLEPELASECRALEAEERSASAS